MSKQINLKNVLRGVIIGLILIFIVCLIFSYVRLYLPYQEMKKQQKALDEWEKMFLEQQKEQQIKQLQQGE